MEYFDELDQHGLETGNVLSRDEVHSKGLWHKAIKMVIINKQKKILIQQRALDKVFWPGMWDMAVTGHVQAGESSLKACIRELKEEVGLTVNEDQIKFLFTFCEVFINEKRTERLFFNCFISQLDFCIDDVIQQKEEINDIKLVDKAEFLKCLDEYQFTNQIEQKQYLNYVLKEM